MGDRAVQVEEAQQRSQAVDDALRAGDLPSPRLVQDELVDGCGVQLVEREMPAAPLPFGEEHPRDVNVVTHARAGHPTAIQQILRVAIQQLRGLTRRCGRSASRDQARTLQVIDQRPKPLQRDDVSLARSAPVPDELLKHGLGQIARPDITGSDPPTEV
jgi:hypothetical protein